MGSWHGRGWPSSWEARRCHRPVDPALPRHVPQKAEVGTGIPRPTAGHHQNAGREGRPGPPLPSRPQPFFPPRPHVTATETPADLGTPSPLIQTLLLSPANRESGLASPRPPIGPRGKGGTAGVRPRPPPPPGPPPPPRGASARPPSAVLQSAAAAAGARARSNRRSRRVLAGRGPGRGRAAAARSPPVREEAEERGGRWEGAAGLGWAGRGGDCPPAAGMLLPLPPPLVRGQQAGERAAAAPGGMSSGGSVPRSPRQH